MSESTATGHTEKLTRIREVAMTVGEPRNAGEIAASAGVARNTAVKYLRQLVEADMIDTVTDGRETRYVPDPVTQHLNHVRELVEAHTKDELTDELEAIGNDTEETANRYDVSSSDELRATLGDEDLSAAERAQRRRDVEDWEHYHHQAEVIRQALLLYDSLETARTARSPSSP